MSLLTLSSLTLNPREASESSEAVFEKTFIKSALSTYHGVQTGIDMTKQIPFFGKFEPFLLADPGSCGTNTVSQTITPTQKYWYANLLSGRLSHCQGTQTDSLFKMWRAQSKANPDYWSTIANEEIAFLEDRLGDVMMEDILLKVMFGDTAADTVANGGNITTGQTAALFTPFDGIWKQILTGVVAETVFRSTITENGEATSAAQYELNSDTAYNAMVDIIENSDSRIFQGNPVFQITRTLWNNYYKYLEANSLATGVELLQDGMANIKFRGYPIIVREDWDRNITQYFNQGATFLNPHRIIFADINNIPVGTLSESDLQSLDMNYDFLTKKHYIDTAMTLDAKLLEEYAISVAY